MARRKQQVPHPPNGSDMHLKEAFSTVLKVASAVEDLTAREKEAITLLRALHVGSYGGSEEEE